MLQDGLAEKIGWKDNTSEVPRKLRDAPFVQIPLGVTEDRLVGTVDIEASMKVGHRLHVCVRALLLHGLSGGQACVPHMCFICCLRRSYMTTHAPV